MSWRALLNQTVCTFSLASNSINAPTKGGTFSVNVTGGNNCDYSAKSNVDWVHVTSAYEMTGNASVTFRVNVNPTITRTGTISIAGQRVYGKSVAPIAFIFTRLTNFFEFECVILNDFEKRRDYRCFIILSADCELLQFRRLE